MRLLLVVDVVVVVDVVERLQDEIFLTYPSIHSILVPLFYFIILSLLNLCFIFFLCCVLSRLLLDARYKRSILIGWLSRDQCDQTLE